MQNRARLDAGANDVKAQMPGMAVMSQLQYENNTTVGASTLTVSSILAGVINRSGAVGAYIDTLPTVAALIAACPQLSSGDSFTFLLRNTVAQALTLAVGTGWTLGSNTAVAASLVREYLVTINSTKAAKVFTATTTNASATLSNVSEADIVDLQPGMALTGTGIGASAKIIAVNANDNTVVVDVVSTATADNIAVTANPTATIEGVRSSTL
jgi:hypothetical protein